MSRKIKREIDLVCSKCGVDLYCVCNRFIVSVHEDSLETTCFACEYKDQLKEKIKLQYTKDRLEYLIKCGLKGGD